MLDPFAEIDFNPLYKDFQATWSLLKSLPDVDVLEGKPIDVHMYWKLQRPFERKQIIPIKSFLATQNFEQVRLHLWSDQDITHLPILKPWLQYINFRIYNPSVEGRDTVLESRGDLLNKDDSMVYLGGDLFRALVLHKHGGVYVDMDSVYLRDIRMLLAEEFMYKWGTHPEYISSAVMYLRKRSELSQRLMEGILALPPENTNWACQNNMRAYAIKPFRVFPAGLFNPEWQLCSTADTFVPNELTTESFRGTFMHHWHNRWEVKIPHNCKFTFLERLTEEALVAKGLLRECGTPASYDQYS